MVNGRQASQFNAEHTHLTDLIMAADEVIQLDRNMLLQIEESLGTITVKNNKASESNSQTSRVSCMGSVADPPQNPISHGQFDDGQSVTNVGASNIVSCPSCDRPLDTLPSICCDTCETWFHFDCEQISEDSRSVLDSSDIGYICLGCKFQSECERLNDSLNVEGRNPRESDPITSDDQTHMKEGYEPNFRNLINIPEMHITDLERSVSSQKSTDPVTSDPLISESSDPIIISSKSTAEDQLKKVNARVLNSDQSDLIRGQGVDLNMVGGATSNVHNSTLNWWGLNSNLVSKEQGNSAENNRASQKPKKKMGKQRLKEAEQEEQLKLARSVINSLERKVGELENSNRILKQEINLVRMGEPPLDKINARHPNEYINPTLHQGACSVVVLFVLCLGV